MTDAGTSADARERTIRAVFAKQAEWCRILGSPFTALLCETAGQRLDRSTGVGRAILSHRGVPDATGDALPLRFAGALHALVRRDRARGLAALYPPQPLPDAVSLWREVAAALQDHDAALTPWMELAPQTNEVGRSALLMAGLHVIAEAAPLPFSLYELGASAGLNLMLDRYRIRYGVCSTGPSDAVPVLAPEWRGSPPPLGEVAVAARCGVDLSPFDARRSADRERILAYIWPDQPERLARTQAALDVTAKAAPAIDRGDAAEWLERVIAPEGASGHHRVVMHSIAAQYFPDAVRDRIAAHLQTCGVAARLDAPLHWLRFELDPGGDEPPALRLTSWPGGGERLLARAHPHCTWVEWQG